MEFNTIKDRDTVRSLDLKKVRLSHPPLVPPLPTGRQALRGRNNSGGRIAQRIPAERILCYVSSCNYLRLQQDAAIKVGPS